MQEWGKLQHFCICMTGLSGMVNPKTKQKIRFIESFLHSTRRIYIPKTVWFFRLLASLKHWRKDIACHNFIISKSQKALQGGTGRLVSPWFFGKSRMTSASQSLSRVSSAYRFKITRNEKRESRRIGSQDPHKTLLVLWARMGMVFLSSPFLIEKDARTREELRESLRPCSEPEAFPR